MEFPQRILVGEGVLGQLGQFIEAPTRRRPVVIASGANVQQKVRDRVTRSLVSSVKWVEVEHSDMKNVEKVMRAASRAYCVIGLGGGKSVDVGKLAAYKIGLPFFSVPTSASHDGISSPFASISGSSKGYSAKAKPPVGILADINVIAAAPRRLEASGCGDLISKLTAVKDWQLANRETGEYYGGYAANLALMSAQVVLERSKTLGRYDQGATRDLVEGLISAGVAAGIAGSSRPCSGSEHLFSHALDSICPGEALHGEQCGMGAIMMAMLHGLEWEKVRDALRDVGAPVSGEQLGISDDDIVTALVRAPSVRPDRYTILTKVKLDRRRARELASETRVI
jgi:glycerol-1-phosphate dehydrogenase [NAD(P)+]